MVPLFLRRQEIDSLAEIHCKSFLLGRILWKPENCWPLFRRSGRFTFYENIQKSMRCRWYCNRETIRLVRTSGERHPIRNQLWSRRGK